MPCQSSCCLPVWRQCDRSAVGALWVEVPRVARGLVALARVRPTAIIFDRSAIVTQAKREESWSGSASREGYYFNETTNYAGHCAKRLGVRREAPLWILRERAH